MIYAAGLRKYSNIFGHFYPKIWQPGSISLVDVVATFLFRNVASVVRFVLEPAPGKKFGFNMAETLTLRGTLEGHNGWVTQIATNPKYPDMILSASRDKSLIVWKLTRDEQHYGVPQKRLHGHGHFVSDVVLSSDGHFALSGSWDKTLRLWDLGTGKTTRRFEDHTKDVMSVAFSADNRQVRAKLSHEAPKLRPESSQLVVQT